MASNLNETKTIINNDLKETGEISSRGSSVALEDLPENINEQKHENEIADNESNSSVGIEERHHHHRHHSTNSITSNSTLGGGGDNNSNNGNPEYQIRNSINDNENYGLECPGAPMHPTINDSTPTPQRMHYSASTEGQGNDDYSLNTGNGVNGNGTGGNTSEYQRAGSLNYTSIPQFIPVSPDMTNSDAGPSPSTPLPTFTSQTQYYGVSEYTEYEFQNKVGEGTFGVVHTAKDSRNKEVVAMKHIFMQNEHEGVPVTALREIKILKQLDHPNIIPLLEIAVKRGNRVARQRGSLYMVFPYMEHDLAGLIENKNVEFTEAHVKCYMKQLLEGTLYLHQNNIMHRDIKCANILVNNKGQLQIGDFGLARSFDPDDKNKEYTNMVVTRWYRPPELLLGETRYTCAIDIWGLGCIFGEILKRVPILRGESELDQLEKIWDLCGTPTDENWPGFRELPGCQDITFKPQRFNCISEKFKSFNPLAVDLLKKMLTLDPKKRITAKEALCHDYFWTEPRPELPENLPKYPPSHELDARRARQQANAEAQRQRYAKNSKYEALSRKPIGGNGPNHFNNSNRGPSRHQSGRYGSHPNVYRPFTNREYNGGGGPRHSSNGTGGGPVRQSYSSVNSTFQPYPDRINHSMSKPIEKHYRQ